MIWSWLADFYRYLKQWASKGDRIIWAIFRSRANILLKVEGSSHSTTKLTLKNRGTSWSNLLDPFDLNIAQGPAPAILVTPAKVVAKPIC